MEPLWRPVAATRGNRSQIASARNRHNQAKTVVVGCDRLPEAAHGKEGSPVRVRKRALQKRRAPGGRPEPSADPLRQLDDDPLRTADVAEPIDVFVVLHLANELPAAGSQAGDGGVDVVDCECEMADARGVRRRVRVAARARRGVELRQLEPSVAVRRLHHRDVRPDALETTTRSTQPPSTVASPCSLSPSSTKNAFTVAARMPRRTWWTRTPGARHWFVATWC